MGESCSVQEVDSGKWGGGSVQVVGAQQKIISAAAS